MTSQGSAHGRSTRAIQRRNLWAAESSLRELGTVSLEDVLGSRRLLREQLGLEPSRRMQELVAGVDDLETER